jgi:hypothetical protein
MNFRDWAVKRTYDVYIAYMNEVVILYRVIVKIVFVTHPLSPKLLSITPLGLVSNLADISNSYSSAQIDTRRRQHTSIPPSNNLTLR